MRSTPYALVLQSIAQDSFPKIRGAAGERSIDVLDRDAFLLIPEVITLLRELRPEEGVGEAMDQLVAFVHHAYVTWEAGNVILTVTEEQLAELVAGSALASSGAPESSGRYYAQVPERRIWARVVPGAAAEPLDGCFVHLKPDGELRVLGIFGFRPERMGFSVVETAGVRPQQLTRMDGTPLFSSTLPGGAAAGVHSLVGAEELLELGWRTRGLLGEPAGVR